MFNPYVKAILGAVAAAVAALSIGIQDGALSKSDVTLAVSAFIVAVSVVWAVGHPVLKWLSASIVAGLAAFADAVLDDAISYSEWLTIAGAVVGSLVLVYRANNTTNDAPNSKTVIE